MPGLKTAVLDLADSAAMAAWKAYTAEKPEAFGYHDPVWLEIIREAFGHPVYPLAVYKDNAISGVLPLVLVASRLFGRFLVSMPFVNYGGTLADDDESAEALLEEASRLMRELKAESVELRYTTSYPSSLPARGHKVSLYLDLEASPDAMWRGFKDKVRNQVRKAQKNGLSVIHGGAELLDDFYKVFQVNMRALGTPVYGKKLFETVLEKLPEQCSILSVRQNGACLAAGITYGHGKVMELPWASSLPAFRNLCPNNLLYWEAISKACSEGYSLFDFGRSSPDSGPWRFKIQWGAKELPLHWAYLLAPGNEMPDLSVNNSSFSLAIKVWQRMPLTLTNLLGPRIVKWIP